MYAKPKKGCKKNMRVYNVYDCDSVSTMLRKDEASRDLCHVLIGSSNKVASTFIRTF